MAKTKRKLQSEATKKKIYKTATQLIQQYGYDHVTIDEICEACGVAKGTFYVHFKSKEDILVELTSGEQADYLNVKHSRFVKAHPQASTFELLENIFITILKFHEKKKTSLMHLTFMRTITKNFLFSESTQLIRQVIKSGIERNEFKPSLSEDEIFTSCQIFLIGVIYRWIILNGEFNVVESSKLHITLLLNSLLHNNN